MKKLKCISVLVLLVAAVACFNKQNTASIAAQANVLIAIPPSLQYPGNADTGYQYLTEGNYLKSGIPLSMYKMMGAKEPQNYLKRAGLNATTPYNYTIIKATNGELVAAPNCLYCHAQKFGDQLIVGMGNSLSDYTSPQDASLLILQATISTMGSKKAEAAKAFLRAAKTANPYLIANSKGVNIADRLTAVLAAHRNPQTFAWQEKPQLKIPDELIPTDVPAWWLLKKKNAMFYSGFGRGNFARFLMASNLLTVTDTAESNEVLSHFYDVLAYLYSIKPPKYPYAINEALAQQGKPLFEKNCSACHGSYGSKENYPNLLVPIGIIKTDSALVYSNYSSPNFYNWFKQSWFTTGNKPANLVPFLGYIAPPLDGVWCTAPYLHNASVPNLATLLNSKLRPTYWSRNFENPAYDFENIGWKYEESNKQYTKSTYNTTVSGYGNSGHNFGDKLSNEERKAVIEYLKTL